MVATFDSRNVIKTILQKYGIPQFAFFSLQTESRVSQWKIQRALRYECDFDHEEARCLVALAKDCEAVALGFPHKLDWRNSVLIQAMIKLLQSKTADEILEQRLLIEKIAPNLQAEIETPNIDAGTF